MTNIAITFDVKTAGDFRQFAVKLQYQIAAAEAATINEVERGIRDDLAKVTATWEHKPVFAATLTKPGGTANATSARIWTTDPIFTYVDQGTAPHIIRPRTPGGLLVFKVDGYRAKTSPGFITSTAGSPGTRTVFARVVKHPGAKPRKFSETITRKWQERAQALMAKRVQMAISGANIMGGWR